MKGFAEYASRTLGIKLPEDYTSFMETYGKKLPEDPIGEKSWIRGLGSPEFVIATTLAFRSTLPGFGSKRVVIGYVGTKTIIVNRTYEDIDEERAAFVRRSRMVTDRSPSLNVLTGAPSNAPDTTFETR